MFKKRAVAFVIAGSSALVATLMSPVSLAQVTAPGFVAKPTLVSPISGVKDKEIAVINISMKPGASSPRHTHPGDCYGTVIEGTVELFVEGQKPIRYSAGQSWHNLPGLAHYFTNVGSSPARLVNTLVTDKGKPRTQMLPPVQK